MAQDRNVVQQLDKRYQKLKKKREPKKSSNRESCMGNRNGGWKICSTTALQTCDGVLNNNGDFPEIPSFPYREEKEKE